MAELKDLLTSLGVKDAANVVGSVGSKPFKVQGFETKMMVSGALGLIDNQYLTRPENFTALQGYKMPLVPNQIKDQLAKNLAAAGRGGQDITWNDLFDPKVGTIQYQGKDILLGDLFHSIAQGKPHVDGFTPLDPKGDRASKGIAGQIDALQGAALTAAGQSKVPAGPLRKGEQRAEGGELGDPVVQAAATLQHSGIVLASVEPNHKPSGGLISDHRGRDESPVVTRT